MRIVTMPCLIGNIQYVMPYLLCKTREKRKAKPETTGNHACINSKVQECTESRSNTSFYEKGWE
jgi:hypothetical protein